MLAADPPGRWARLPPRELDEMAARPARAAAAAGVGRAAGRARQRRALHVSVAADRRAAGRGWASRAAKRPCDARGVDRAPGARAAGRRWARRRPRRARGVLLAPGAGVG